MPVPVLCHNSLTPGIARPRTDGAVVVAEWHHAGGQPPAWELCEALTHWAVDPDGGVNAAGARPMVDGYLKVAGEVPPSDLSTFRGTAVGLCNDVAGEVAQAMDAETDEDRRYADRSVHHLLTHLPTRATFDALLRETLGREPIPG